MLPGFVTGRSFMSVWFLVLKLGQCLLIRDWLQIWKSEISRLSFAQYLETSTHYICHAFTVSELLMQNQEGGVIFSPTQIRVKSQNSKNTCFSKHLLIFLLYMKYLNWYFYEIEHLYFISLHYPFDKISTWLYLTLKQYKQSRSSRPNYKTVYFCRMGFQILVIN